MVKRQRFLVLVVNRFAKTISFGKFNVGRTTDAIILVGSEFSSGVTAATHELRRKARLEGETALTRSVRRSERRRSSSLGRTRLRRQGSSQETQHSVVRQALVQKRDVGMMSYSTLRRASNLLRIYRLLSSQA